MRADLQRQNRPNRLIEFFEENVSITGADMRDDFQNLIF